MASRVLAIDILLPNGYTGAWATDLDRLTETFDTSNPNLTFPNLVSFKWQGARTAKHGLPAPYYDFNALPLAQLREVIVKGTPISIVDAYHLLDVCSALEEVELTIMKDRFLLDDSALTLECPQLRSLRISSYADLAHFFCLLDAPSLREVVYTPLGDALTIYTFPWNAIVPSLRRFVLVGSENIDPEVCDILEEACEGDDVQLQILLYAEDIFLL
ncbi:hypothetical protein BKA70DRAFT_1523135 [Coprinopsis sp. MPI-PUGE-AT-0042]|nr:hypothetical protein BKA70DRAFT_1523135 [Coprinopsis sp. MPI-PUGE-AT-0042]